MAFTRIRAGARHLCVTAGAVSAFAATGLLLCSGSGSAAGPPAAGGETIRVAERDFHITASATTVSAGRVSVRIHNAGPDQHELIILPLHRGQAPSGLPLRSDGFTVNEEALQNQEPGSLNPQRAGSTEP